MSLRTLQTASILYVWMPAPAGASVIKFFSGLVITATLDRLKSCWLLRADGHRAADPWSRPRQRRGREKKRCERLQQCDCAGGLRAKLKANPYKPQLPSILLSNVCSLDNKRHHLQFKLDSKKEISNCCTIIMTESWLNSSISDNGVNL